MSAAAASESRAPMPPITMTSDAEPPPLRHDADYAASR